MTDSEWIANIHNFSNAEIFEQLEQIGCDGYYRDIWSACIEELQRRVNLTSGDLISRSELLKHTEGGDYDGCGGFTPEYVSIKYIKNAPAYGKENDNATTVTVDNYSMGYQDGVRKVLSERPKGECKTCRHHDPEDRKCDCGGLERQGCPFPVGNDYYCKYYEKGGVE